MARKRYHYDAKGRLKGYTTDKYQPRLRDVILIAIAIAGWSLLTRGDDNEKPTPTHSVSEVDPRPASSSGGDRARLAVQPQASEARRSPEDEGNKVEDPQDETASGFERDLKPYYETECANGDRSACDTLAKELR